VVSSSSSGVAGERRRGGRMQIEAVA
jgi:hypothetical protein